MTLLCATYRNTVPREVELECRLYFIMRMVKFAVPCAWSMFMSFGRIRGCVGKSATMVFLFVGSFHLGTNLKTQ